VSAAMAVSNGLVVPADLTLSSSSSEFLRESSGRSALLLTPCYLNHVVLELPIKELSE